MDKKVEKSLSEIGTIAVHDEVTGFQKYRNSDFLRAKMMKSLTTFSPEEFWGFLRELVASERWEGHEQVAINEVFSYIESYKKVAK